MSNGSGPIPEPLLEVVRFLQKARLTLPVSAVDTRGDSSQAEGFVIKALMNHRVAGLPPWNVVDANYGQGHNRQAYDATIDGHHTDLKVTEVGKRRADNTNAKAAIGYVLTGQFPAPGIMSARSYFPWLKEHESPCEVRDYYYLVVDKADTGDVFAASLRTLAAVRPSSANPPFQAVWDECRKPTCRSWNEAKTFLLRNWAESIKRAQETLAVMPRVYPEFFEGTSDIGQGMLDI